MPLFVGYSFTLMRIVQFKRFLHHQDILLHKQLLFSLVPALFFPESCASCLEDFYNLDLSTELCQYVQLLMHVMIYVISYKIFGNVKKMALSNVLKGLCHIVYLQQATTSHHAHPHHHQMLRSDLHYSVNSKKNILYIFWLLYLLSSNKRGI